MKLQHRYKTNDINEIFTHKMSYEKHKKKLQELTKRKSFYINSDRINQLETFKVRKHSAFIKDIEDRNKQIGRDNLRIFSKLLSSNQNDSVSKSIVNQTQSNLMNPRRKKNQMKTQLENRRMFHKLKSLQNISYVRVPTINTKKISEQYEKTLKIKNRISRYQLKSGSNKILSKSERLLNLSFPKTSRSKENLQQDKSRTSEKIIPKLKINENSIEQHPINVLNKEQRNLSQFYKRQQILKNKVNQSFKNNNARKRLSQFEKNIIPLSQNKFRQSYNLNPQKRKLDELILDEKTLFATQITKQQNPKTVQINQINQEAKLQKSAQN